MHVLGMVVGGTMGHSWVFEVLADLRDYATANGLPRVAAKVEELIIVARAELAERGAAAGDGSGNGDV